MQFTYTILKETEKAVFAKVPYWEATSDLKRKHKQLYYECWIPKSILLKGDEFIKFFVISERDRKRTSNAYQRKFCKMPNSWNTMGEVAPQKLKKVIEVVDEETVSEKLSAMLNKYSINSIDYLINNGIPNEEDYNLAVILRFQDSEIGKKNQHMIPKKQKTIFI